MFYEVLTEAQQAFDTWVLTSIKLLRRSKAPASQARAYLQYLHSALAPNLTLPTVNNINRTHYCLTNNPHQRDSTICVTVARYLPSSNLFPGHQFSIWRCVRIVRSSPARLTREPGTSSLTTFRVISRQLRPSSIPHSRTRSVPAPPPSSRNVLETAHHNSTVDKRSAKLSTIATQSQSPAHEAANLKKPFRFDH